MALTICLFFEWWNVWLFFLHRVWAILGNLSSCSRDSTWIISSFRIVDEIQSFVLARVSSLVNGLRACWDRMGRVTSAYRYVYYNGVNWALKSSVGTSRKIARETLQVMASMHAAIEQERQSAPSEIVLRTADGTWLVAKKVEQRELFVVLESSNDTLLDVEQHCRALSTSLLSTIFFWNVIEFTKNSEGQQE